MEAKAKTIGDFKLHERDTGSADVQIALLTQRINHLTDHLQKFKKDQFPPRAADDGRPAPPLAGLSAHHRRQSLPGDHQKAQAAQIAGAGGGGLPNARGSVPTRKLSMSSGR